MLLVRFDVNVLGKERHFACLNRSRNHMTRVKTMEKKLDDAL